ncbi:copper oxidase [Nocardia sp. 852002-20019_SCH5090214]|jgi:FtsP/CotA-like multicopper oxidase with cupredoxin domain|uniref:Multicopper oxidase MmcO n=2 Tax=Nocardia TaxID=1817 RepID=A0A231GVK1_9NOCA|nr:MULTISPECIES: multicopper oxidase domain-containing protein [Nocardia]MDN2495338.1 twin-arginine translocation signal domain-containing protein [Nocardia nova]OBA50076.1 copper oxidase [Nocardia sp. 852002-20019_SCH5090214]OXR40602.1 Multicopper oxidase MmcO [Nocardia cerradoensis]PPJ10773.1 copper oxidase [Nocardia nova]PPJ17362.1 copper oxidase [Nocardia nova]
MSRRDVLKLGGAAVVAGGAAAGCGRSPSATTADYTLRIAAGSVEVAPGKTVSTTLYNGQFPGPLLRLTEGTPMVVDVYNDTATPEQVHWHGQAVPAEVDGAAEEGTPFVPAHGMRQLSCTPGPAGYRFYHTHLAAGSDLTIGQYNGLVGPVYIEPASHPGAYDQEVFLTLKEFEPSLSQGGDMAADFLAGEPVPQLRDRGEAAMAASLASGAPHGYEVGYATFTINGRMLGHGDPIKVKQGQRVLLHVLNGSATENRSLALPGHTFTVIALDGNPVPNPVAVPVLWLGTAERVSAIVEMTNPGVWVLGDLSDDDRGNGMGIVVEYAGATGDPVWTAPPAFRWDYRLFADPRAHAPAAPDQVFDMLIEKRNAADGGFNVWTINGQRFTMSESSMQAQPMWQLERGKRYRLHLRNATDDIHPMHLHRHTFELTHVAGTATAGLRKDVAMLGGYQQMDIDFVADQPGLSLLHCHMQLHMDYGFMGLFDCH